MLPGALLFMGETESEAQEKYDMLNSLIPLRVAMQRLSANLGGVDLQQFDLDAPVPDIPVNNQRVSAVQSYIAIARRDGLTLRQMAMRSAAAKHHWTLIGSVKQVADELESWFLEGAADGFNVIPSDVPAPSAGSSTSSCRNSSAAAFSIRNTKARPCAKISDCGDRRIDQARVIEKSGREVRSGAKHHSVP